jgi:hypothetical protein
MGKPMKARKGLTASSESLKTTVNSFCNKTVSFKIAAGPAKTNIKFMFKWICFSRPIIKKFLSGALSCVKDLFRQKHFKTNLPP